MSSPSELLPGTSIAATSWATGGLYHLRVYTQDIHGQIRESRWDNGWSGGTSAPKDVVAKAKPRSPIAVFNYNEGKSIRVYYLSTDNIIQEICQDNGGAWFAGELNNAKIEASPVSRLAVIGKTWNNHYISVYYQRPDEAIGEVGQDARGWAAGGAIGGKAILGTGLAALTFHTTKDGNGIRVYYQEPNGTLTEAGINEGNQWFTGAFGSQGIDYAALDTNIAVFSHGVDNPYFQVYFLDKQNIVTEWGYYGGSWKGSNHPREASDSPRTTTSPGSGIAIVQVQDAKDLRVYIQDENTNRIQEYIQQGLYWRKGSLIPIGGLL